MMRPRAVCLLLLSATTASAGVLFQEAATGPATLESTTPQSVTSELPPPRLPPHNPPHAHENGGQLIAKVVSRVEPPLRKPAPAGATNAQRDALRAEKWHAMKSLCDQLIGRPATFSIEVLDVLNRPMPAPPPPPLTGGATIDQVKKRDAAVRAHEAQMRTWANESMMVVGRVARTNPLPDSAHYRRQVARLTNQADQDLRAANVQDVGRPPADRNATPTSYAARKKEIRDRLKSDLAELKLRRDAAIPPHTVYLVGGNPEFATWKRGQLRAVSGVIYQATMQVHTGAPQLSEGQDPAAATPITDEDYSEACISLELALKSVPVQTPAGPPQRQ